MEQYSADSSRGQSDDIESIRLAIESAAQKRVNDCEALLALLRQLEELHRDIRETLFQEALPTNRQRLYKLLRDVEVHGGWPYIQRMKLVELLNNMDTPSGLDGSEE